jgi:hypothetical protein
MDGKGEFIWTDKDICRGTWKNKKLNGYAKCTIKSKKYKGIYKNGKLKTIFS